MGLVWLVQVIGFLAKHKGLAGTGVAGGTLGVLIFTASASYSDKADEQQNTKSDLIQVGHRERYDQILWRLDAIQMSNNKQEKRSEILEQRIWELRRFYNEVE